MFRIRSVYDDSLPADSDAIAQVQDILRSQFSGLSEREIRKLPAWLRNPLKYRFRSILFVVESHKGVVDGFALLLHEPNLRFCYLDYISAARKKTGAGIGGALYERVREEAIYLGATGLFFECLPDDPKLSTNPEIRKQNAARLRFYERYGARPIAGTAYETPVEPGGDNPPYLVYDGLASEEGLPLEKARTIVLAILERKYSGVVGAVYIDQVFKSFKDDPVKLREPKYIKKQLPVKPTRIPKDKRILLLVNDRHAIHHIEERGYVESPVRIASILEELDKTELFIKAKPRRFSESHIKAVHDRGFFDYFKKVCANLEPGQSIYPYVFPIRNQARPPRELPVRAGYYCIDTFTPINKNAFLAARRAVDCTLTAARSIIQDSTRLAYSLVRPPGHHAEPRSFGGFCYFNSAAIAAHYLSNFGKVAILDIDYHHGNGTERVFYRRPDVLTISVHGHPGFAYPYFSGFADEKGEDEGKGFNLNIPLPEKLNGRQYLKALQTVTFRLRRFRPRFLVVALGLDTAREDPTGSWSLEAEDFRKIGKMLGTLRLPTLVVQEGGYDTRVLGINARAFFEGLWQGAY